MPGIPPAAVAPTSHLHHPLPLATDNPVEPAATTVRRTCPGSPLAAVPPPPQSHLPPLQFVMDHFETSPFLYPPGTTVDALAWPEDAEDAFAADTIGFSDFRPQLRPYPEPPSR